MKNFKISVHIPYYISDNYVDKSKLLKRVCNSYLKLSKKVKIFIHTNKKLKANNKKIKFIFHDLSKIHSYKLTWVCRKLMLRQKNLFDIFIYGEDDLLFTKNNFNYWLKYRDKCLNDDFNLGFLRVEKRKKNNLLYSSDQITKVKKYVLLKKEKFAKLESSNSSLWVYTREELKKFSKTRYWNFNFKWITVSGILLIREMAAVGWHGENMNGQYMNRYKATIIPIKNNKLDKDSFIKHISNNYANNPAGLFGSLKVDSLLSKELNLFKERTLIFNLIKRLNFILYYLFRFNFKKLIKS
ncbi:hypothetical protein OAL70_05010 [Pelagibacteraceae bacterium]|nr:hypothetical protein [Pelagibacteraceae bacterium]